MATSSITHNFVISSAEGAQTFISALDAAENARGQFKPQAHGRLLTDQDEIAALMERRKCLCGTIFLDSH